MQSANIFVAIAGNIGSGKTTLTNLLSKKFGWRPHFEVVTENPYLADFYGDMNRWSFPLQVFFLNTRFKAHRAILNGQESSIQDRTIYEDAYIFARNLHDGGQMSDRDYSNYLEIFKSICELLSPPDLMVYLRRDLNGLRRRIRERGRDYEQTISDKYLLDLNRYYDEWINQYDLGRKIIIDTDELDFLHNPQDFEAVAQKIVGSLDQIDLFLSDAKTLSTTEEQHAKSLVH